MTNTAAADVADSMRQIVDELGEEFLERGEAIQALAVAMLAGQHSLVLGPPGTGKSALARALTGRVDGARYWEILLSKFTAPTSIFGPIDVAALSLGEYKQILDGRATTAHVAFIDEVFKCSTASLNSMLSYLNERIYHPEAGGDPIECPLIAAVCASNELSSGEDSAAIYDRMVVRLVVDYLEDPSSFAELMKSAVVPATAPKRTTVDLADLQKAVTTHVPAVAIPNAVVDAVCELRRQLRHEELISSDRRWKTAMRLIQASAYLAGRNEADATDLMVLRHVLWEDPEDRAKVARTVLQLASPGSGEALDWADAAAELDAQLTAMAGQTTSKTEKNQWASKEANTKLNAAVTRLRELITDAKTAGQPTTHLETAMTKVVSVQVRVMVECMGVDPTLAKGMLTAAAGFGN